MFCYLSRGKNCKNNTNKNKESKRNHKLFLIIQHRVKRECQIRATTQVINLNLNPRIDFQCRLSYSIRTTTCINICLLWKIPNAAAVPNEHVVELGSAALATVGAISRLGDRILPLKKTTRSRSKHWSLWAHGRERPLIGAVSWPFFFFFFLMDRNLRLLDVLIGQDEVVVHDVVVEGVVVYVTFRRNLPVHRVLISARVVHAACTRHHTHTIRLVPLARPRAEAARSRGWTRGQGIGLDSTRRWVRISVWTMTVFSFSSALEWWT